MKLPSYKRIFKTDYPKEFQTIADKLASSINIGFESLYNALNRKLTLRDNIFCSIREFTVQVDSSGKPSGTTGISLEQAGTIEGATVLQVTNLTNASNYTSGAVQVYFSSTANGVIIDNIKGLNTGDNYRIKLVIYQF